MFGFFGTKTATVPTRLDPSIRRSHLSPEEFVTRPAGDEVVVMGDVFAYTVRASSPGL